MKNFLPLLFLICSVLPSYAGDIEYGYRNGDYVQTSIGNKEINYGYRNGSYVPTSIGRRTINYGYRNGRYAPVGLD